MKLKVQMLDDDEQVLSEVMVRGIPEDLHEHPVDLFADQEGRLREAAGAAAFKVHQRAVALLAQRV